MACVYVYTSSIRKLVTNRKERKHCDVTLFSFVEFILISFSRVKLLALPLPVRCIFFCRLIKRWFVLLKIIFFYQCKLFNIICIFNVKECERIKLSRCNKNARLFPIHFVKFMFIFLIFILYIFLFF